GSPPAPPAARPPPRAPPGPASPRRRRDARASAPFTTGCGRTWLRGVRPPRPIASKPRFCAVLLGGPRLVLARAMRKLSALVSLALAGCLSANAHNDPIASGQDAGSGNSQGSPVGAPMCGETPHPMDPATLPSCCTDGAAHCLPASLVPGAATSLLSACSGGYCVPDPFIRAG